jgi:acetyl esterase/lipase
VTWREQVADVATATTWVRDHIAEYGGAEDRIFLMGHSAGAQLATFVALNGTLLQERGASTKVLCGAVPVSGAGYDLVDEETYRLGARRDYNASRFQAGDPDGVWERAASALTYLSDRPQDVPPFLLPFSLREWPGLQYQNRLLHDTLQDLGVESRLLPVKGQSHARMVLQLTDPDSSVSAAVLEFFGSVPCPRG